jgi:ferredoxin
METSVTRYQVLIEDTGETYSCDQTRSLLSGMEALGRKGIPAGCRNGGCGVCKVQITSGTWTARVMSREHVSEQEQEQGCVLACRAMPTSDLKLAVVGKMKKSVCWMVETTSAGSANDSTRIN